MFSALYLYFVPAPLGVWGSNLGIVALSFSEGVVYFVVCSGLKFFYKQQIRFQPQAKMTTPLSLIYSRFSKLRLSRCIFNFRSFHSRQWNIAGLCGYQDWRFVKLIRCKLLRYPLLRFNFSDLICLFEINLFFYWEVLLRTCYVIHFSSSTYNR